MTNAGFLQIRISKPIVEFPSDLKSLTDRNAKGYVEKDGVIKPDINAEPWIQPLILLKVIASDDSRERDLLFDWELESYSETQLNIRLRFVTPMKVSQSLKQSSLSSYHR